MMHVVGEQNNKQKIKLRKEAPSCDNDWISVATSKTATALSSVIQNNE